MQNSYKLSLLCHPSQKTTLDKWSALTGQQIDHHHDVQNCCETFASYESAIIFVGWNAHAPGISAKHLSLIKADIHTNAYIVVIADRDSENDVVQALQLGADRYLCSDTPISILSAVIEALERRIVPAEHIHHYAPYRLDDKTRAVYFGSNRVVLTPREFRIALYLFENQDRPLSRESLLKDVWGLPELKYNRRVDTKMSHLRRKLQLDGGYGWILKFPRGKGYRLQRMTRSLPDTDIDRRSAKTRSVMMIRRQT